MRKIRIYIIFIVALFVIHSVEAQQTNDSIVNQAKSNAKTSDYEKAMQSLDALIQKWMDQKTKKETEVNTDSILKLANDAAENEEYDEAILQVQKVREIWEERHLIENPPNTDSIFELAIASAREKNYDEAREHADEVLKILPERLDVLIFKANVDAWESKFDSAKIKLAAVYKMDSKNQELYDSWLNVYLWNKEYEKVLSTADLAEKNSYKNRKNLTIKRAYALDGLMEYDSAVKLLDKPENKILRDSTIKPFYEEVLLKSKRNFVTFYYAIDLFEGNSPLPQHLAYIDYGFKIKKNTLVLRLNYANRYNLNGVQLEADYYWAFPREQYLYLNYGFALTNELFPRHKGGFEYFFNMKHGFDGSVGARYIDFSEKQIFVITGHLGKSVNHLWFALRPYFSFEKTGNYISLVGNARWFGQNRLNFWGVELGYGNSPDERYLIDPTGNYFSLNSYRIKIEKGIKTGTLSDLRLGLSYYYEEIQKSVPRSRINFEVIYKVRF